MIPVEELDALDLLIWLGRGSDAATRLSCNQSTISRRTGHCLRVFDLRLHRDADGWPCTRRHDLLQMEREVHQLYRLTQSAPLRIDASLLAAPLLRNAIPDGWIGGNLDELGWQRPLQLLSERILDAWITAMGQELPPEVGSEFRCVPLLQTPLLLAAAAGHPLIREPKLHLSDVADLPRLAPQPGHYPRTERLLGDWRQHRRPMPLRSTIRTRRSDGAVSEQSSDPLLLHYGTGFSLAYQQLLTPLALELGVETCLTLVMRRDVSERPQAEQLIELLQARARQAAGRDLGLAWRN
jgi:hypothetical protein